MSYSGTVTVTDASGQSASASVSISSGTKVWPDASTTGYGSTTLVAATSNTISAPGIYNGLHFTGVVNIKASNVTLQNCLITARAADPWSMGIPAGYTGIVIKNTEFAGAGTAGGVGTYGIYVQGNSGVTIDACNFHDSGQCVVMNDGQIVLQNSYAHDLHAGSGTHYECVGYFGAAKSGAFSLLIRNNNLNCQINQTAAVFTQNYFGALENVTIDNNLLIGGAYTVYVDGKGNTSYPVRNIKVTNNAMGRGTYGYIYPSSNAVYQVTVSGNYDWITGAPVS